MAETANTQLIYESILGEELSMEECGILSEIVKHKELSKEEVLFDAGTKDGMLYILIKGKLDIFKETGGTGGTVHIATVNKGSMIGELSFIDDEAHSMKLVSRKKASVLFLSKEDFEAKLESHPKVVYNIMRSIMRYSHRLQQKMMQENVELRRMMQNSYM